MSRNANVIILCEDRQHEAFARRFLVRAGYHRRRLRVQVSPKGRGSGEQFVRERFGEELGYYRNRQHRVQQVLVVLIDADKKTTADRIRQMERICSEGGVQPRQPNERVAVFVPARNIETWLAYLGGETVDETRERPYPRLRHESDCQQHVNALHDMCARQTLRQPSPPSLDAACNEYQTRLRS
jgi:hypothetical protein